LVDAELPSAARFSACYFLIARSEAFAYWQAGLASHAGKIGAIARRNLVMGALLDEDDVRKARHLRIDLTREMAATFGDLDVLCLPTMPGEAGPLAPDDAVTRPDTAPYTRPFGLVGAPAISLSWRLRRNGRGETSSPISGVACDALHHPDQREQAEATAREITAQGARAVNLQAYFATAQEAARGMVARGWGRIIMISSVNQWTPAPDWSPMRRRRPA